MISSDGDVSIWSDTDAVHICDNHPAQHIYEEVTMELSKVKMSDTTAMMLSSDYKVRFFAEYTQTKIRYEKLKDLCNRIEVARMICDPEPEHDCPLSLLRDQQKAMGEYLRILELRAIIEHVDLGMEE